MTARDQFEKLYAEQHDLPAETFAQYRMGDSYRLPAIAKAWRWFMHGFESQVPTVDALLNHCNDAECVSCGEIICPHKDGMHFHHDGCPSCAQEHQS